MKTNDINDGLLLDRWSLMQEEGSLRNIPSYVYVGLRVWERSVTVRTVVPSMATRE